MSGCLTSDIAVALRIRVSCIEDDFPGKKRPDVAREVGHRLQWNGDHNDIAESCRVGRPASRRLWSKRLDDRLELVGVTRGQLHLMAGVDPQLANRRADHPCSNDAYTHGSALRRIGGTL